MRADTTVERAFRSGWLRAALRGIMDREGRGMERLTKFLWPVLALMVAPHAGRLASAPAEKIERVETAWDGGVGARRRPHGDRFEPADAALLTAIPGIGPVRGGAHRGVHSKKTAP
jgi:transposase